MKLTFLEKEILLPPIRDGYPGKSTLSFSSENPFWVYDLVLLSDTPNLAYVESIQKGGSPFLDLVKLPQSFLTFKELDLLGGKLIGIFLQTPTATPGAPLEILLCNLSTVEQRVRGFLFGRGVE